MAISQCFCYYLSTCDMFLMSAWYSWHSVAIVYVHACIWAIEHVCSAAPYLFCQRWALITMITQCCVDIAPMYCIATSNVNVTTTHYCWLLSYTYFFIDTIRCSDSATGSCALLHTPLPKVSADISIPQIYAALMFAKI